MFLLLFFGLSVCSGTEKLWEKEFGGSDYDCAQEVLATDDGGYILVGSTRSYGQGGTDIWVVKTDFEGDREWDKSFGGPKDEEGWSIDRTEDSGFVISGSTASFGAGGSDAWLIRIDQEGEQDWSRTFGGAKDDAGFSVQSTRDGNFIMTGYTTSEGSDLWVIKVDGDGNRLWDRTFSVPMADAGSSIQETVDGGYIVSGFKVSPGAGKDVWILRLDSEGDLIWERSFGSTPKRSGGPMSDDAGVSVKETMDGGYAVYGYSGMGRPEKPDAWLIKLNRSGELEWEENMGGSESDQGYSMTQARDGGLILAGRTASQGSGGYDAWIVKVDSDGGPIWNSTLGGSDDQAAHSVIENGDGIILAGLTGGEGAGGDMWLVKLEAALGSSQAENSIPKIIELLPDLKSPQLAGVAVTWTALAKDVENDTLEFQFKIDGATARDWSSNQAWTLVSGESAIGSHEIEVGVRDGKHAIDGRADASMVMQYVFQSEPEQNSPPVVDSLSADPAGPAPVGTTIIWTAHASDPDGDHLEYRFTQDGIVARDWSGSNAFEMTPAVRMLCTASSTDNMSVCQAEEAVIEVEAGVRDGKHATDGRSDATMTAYLSIESERQVALSSDELEANRSFAVGAPMNAPENLPPIVTSLTADPASPQPFGTAVRFTAIAADPDGDPIEYGFVTGNTSIRDWSEDNVLIWQPGYPHYSVGTTEIFLEIRDKKHSEFADAWMSIEYTLLPA